MRVAILSHQARGRDAVGNQVAEKVSFFLERGAEVQVFVESGDELHPLVRPVCHVFAGWSSAGALRGFLTGADLVFVEFSQSYPLLQILPALVGGKARIIVDYFGVSPPDGWASASAAALEDGRRLRGLAWCADRCLVNSRFAARELRQGSGLPPERIVRIGLPLDASLAGAAADRDDWRRQRGWEHACVLLFVGRLAPNKRVPMLVEVLRRLRDHSPPVHAVVIGDCDDVYAQQADKCRALAQAHGVADRLHLLGRVSDEDLAAAYRGADVFVMPSVHEGFCLPVIEAMAHGLPVVAARAGALPETVSDAGLTFAADDADNLVRQVTSCFRAATERKRSVCENSPAPSRSRLGDIAIVSVRYGTDFVGGAEVSLRKMALVLAAAGHQVEVFTTCTRAEGDWSNELPAGTTRIDGIRVHRFPIDPHDRPRHLATVRQVVDADGPVSQEIEQEYLRHTVHSRSLMEALRRRVAEFQAIIAGPYLFGLTCDVAAEFPEKTLIAPCFLDEPIARLSIWPRVYGAVGGVLYHSPEEQEFAQAELGVNHPNAIVVGTFLDSAEAHGRRSVGGTAHGPPSVGLSSALGLSSAPPYLLYCGRYSAEKGLPQLLQWAERYQLEHADRFRWKFIGQGAVEIPRRPWAEDLGFVDEERKRLVLGQAAAFVLLSRQESLSLAALEAWALGTSVIAHGQCEVLAGHLQRSQAGRAVGGYEDFARALDDLWSRPQRWREAGQRGRAYVEETYSSPADFTRRLQDAIAALDVPLTVQMRRRGLIRAAAFSRPSWREQFGRLVEQVLDEPPRAHRFRVDVEARQPQYTAAAGAPQLLVPIRVTNRGTHTVVGDGPARTVLCAQVIDVDGRETAPPSETPLPGLLVPGKSLAGSLVLNVPSRPGDYLATAWACRIDRPEIRGKDMTLPLTVRAENSSAAWSGMILDEVHAALLEVHQKKRLPDDYVDVTQGWFARAKRWIKRKLLGNFKHAYVDVLSRQQSRVNGQMLLAVQQLAECCQTLEHAVRILQEGLSRLEVKEDSGTGVSPVADGRDACPTELTQRET